MTKLILSTDTYRAHIAPALCHKTAVAWYQINIGWTFYPLSYLTKIFTHSNFKWVKITLNAKCETKHLHICING